MKKRSFFLFLLPVLLAGACASPRSDTITQVSTIDALLAGVYDGHLTLAELRTYGDFGLGTFDRLEGEMILLDGVFYQVKCDGRVYLPPLSTRTPFAAVTWFTVDYRETVDHPLDMAGLEEKIRGITPGANLFRAFRLRGEFSRVRTRSVPAQEKPYPPLAEVAAVQPVFELEDVAGTLVGFLSPGFVRGVNVPGFHMHFIAEDLSGGGHVLAFELARGVLEADTVHDALLIHLPVTLEAFVAADLSPDRSEELERVEKGQR